MLWWQLAGQGLVLLVLTLLLAKLLSEFKTSKRTFYPLFIVLPLFTAGFALRLSNSKGLVDFGFFFTEISYLFTYLLFTVALILGQKKYWKLR